jgi:MFS transporter, DHA1 family, multidrug resistance protein
VSLSPEVPGRWPAPVSGGFIALVAALMTMAAMTIDINLPAIPATAAELGGSLIQGQLTVTVFFMGFALGQAFWGPVSDRFGRRPPLLAGIGLYLVATGACLMASSMEQLLAMRALQGVAAGAGAVLSRAVVRDLFQGAQMARVMSLVTAAFVTAPMIAPSLGALLLELGSWRLIFAFLGFYGVCLFFVAARYLPETVPCRNPGALRLGRLLDGYVAVLGHPDSRVWTAIGTLTVAALAIYLANAPVLLMERYGMSARSFGLLFAAIALTAAIGNLLNARLVRHVSLPDAVGIGIAGCLGASLLGCALAVVGPPAAWALVPGFALFFLSFGLVIANGTTLALAPHGAIAGASASALGVMQTLVPALLASLVAALYDGTVWPTVLAFLLLASISTGLYLLQRRSTARS